MEQLLHYVWRHRIFPLEPLCTTDGQPVEVIDAGLPNPDAGPDFFNAKLKIGDTLWVGNVEIHTYASDWLRHGHHRDVAYDSVILHVVGEADCQVYRTNGEAIPQLALPCPDEVRQRYNILRKADFYPPCHDVLSRLSRLTVHSWYSALLMERLAQKTQTIAQRLKRHNQHWADTFFITLARNFGFGLNGDAFEMWAETLPFRAVDKHRDNLTQVEAFFFGQAGLLEEDLPQADPYYTELRHEFRFLQHKFSLPAPIRIEQWKFARLRPGNFPHVRIAQLAALYHQQEGVFSRAMEAQTADEAKALFAVTPSAYWNGHFHFHKVSPHQAKTVGGSALNLLIINTVVPMLYAYGQYKADERLYERATRFLESLKAENNRITRMWSGCGLTVRTAADSQALIQLQKAYCDRKDCLHCRFGYEFLKGKKGQ